MKNIKSGALTLFAALAMISSHETHANPKGKSLSAMSKAFAHKSLDLTKEHPIKSFSPALAVLGGAEYATYERTMARAGDEIKRTKNEHPELKIPAAPCCEKNIAEKPEMAEERVNPMQDIASQEMSTIKKDLISKIDEILRDGFEGEFSSLHHHIEALRNVALESSDDEALMDMLSGAVWDLGALAKAGSALEKSIDLYDSAQALAAAMRKREVSEEGKLSIAHLAIDLEFLCHKHLFDAFLEVESKLRASGFLKDLSKPLLKLKEDAKLSMASLSLSPGDRRKIMSALRNLEYAADTINSSDNANHFNGPAVYTLLTYAKEKLLEMEHPYKSKNDLILGIMKLEDDAENLPESADQD